MGKGSRKHTQRTLANVRNGRSHIHGKVKVADYLLLKEDWGRG